MTALHMESEDAERGLAIAHDGADVIAIARDYHVRVWDGVTGRMRFAPESFLSTFGRFVSELNPRPEFDLAIDEAARPTAVTTWGTIMLRIPTRGVLAGSKRVASR